MSWGEHIPPNKVTAHHINTRYRLSEHLGSDYWFDYEDIENEEEYNPIAKNVISLLKSEDINWVSSLFE